jgi:hypothetical protein
MVRNGSWIAVGMPIAEHPPHRSGQARFEHQMWPATVCRAFLVERRGRGDAIGGQDCDPRRSTKNVLD